MLKVSVWLPTGTRAHTAPAPEEPSPTEGEEQDAEVTRSGAAHLAERVPFAAGFISTRLWPSEVVPTTRSAQRRHLGEVASPRRAGPAPTPPVVLPQARL